MFTVRLTGPGGYLEERHFPKWREAIEFAEDEYAKVGGRADTVKVFAPNGTLRWIESKNREVLPTEEWNPIFRDGTRHLLLDGKIVETHQLSPTRDLFGKFFRKTKSS